MTIELSINQALLRQAVETWGADAQMTLAFEECGEFISALAQFRRGRESNVVEEIADVLILMVQMMMLFDPNGDKIPPVIDFKMQRLQQKLLNPRKFTSDTDKLKQAKGIIELLLTASLPDRVSEPAIEFLSESKDQRTF